MIEMFSSIRRSLLKPDIDDLVFRAHYNFTFVALAACSVLVAVQQLFGDPIDCDPLRGDAMVSCCCWTRWTQLTLPCHYGRRACKYAAHYKFYGWVCFALVFQSVGFHVPRYWWKRAEERVQKTAIEGLAPTRHSRRRLTLARYFDERFCDARNVYATRFFLCEAYNVANVLLHMYLMDGFSSYAGADVPRAFTEVTKCAFRSYDRTSDGVLEGIHVFLWLYSAAGLLLISLAALLYRATTLTMLSCRALRFRSSTRRVHARIAERFSVGDWFVAYQLAKDMDAVELKECLSVLARSSVDDDDAEEEDEAALVEEITLGIKKIVINPRKRS